MKRGNVFRDRKTIILAGLILLLVVVNVRQWGPANGVSPDSKGMSTPRRSSTVEQDPVLTANQLKESKIEFKQEKRNIFSFSDQPSAIPSDEEEAAAAMAEATPPPESVCGNSICEPGEDPTNCPTDCQPPPPPAPVVNLRYIGYMSEPKGSVAFLTDGKEVYMARVNDVVANQYRVLKITEESIELGLLSNNQSSTIRFQGNQGG